MDRYLPASRLLNDVINGRVRIEGTTASKRNFRKVLALMRDPDVSNRDWATFIVGHASVDTLEIRSALLDAANDSDLDVRDEAIVGLARRDPNAAIERLKPLLTEQIGIVLLEAAAILGDPSLVQALEVMTQWECDSEKTRQHLQIAIEACRAGVGDIKSGSPGYLLTNRS